MTYQVHIVGGGLAGSEAAWQLAEAGLKVRLSEMRGAGEMTAAHQTDGLAELVCSNSFRSDDAVSNAVGLLHAEMRAMGSLIMAAADAHRVPAGSALAVDREGFSAAVTERLAAHPNVEIVRERVDALPAAGLTIVATGPLTAPALAEAIGAATGADALAFFDAIAPIVHRDSIDMDICWMASRWDKGETKDYINCPMTKEQYLAFHQGLLDGEKGEFRDWEKNTPYFEGCMPIEVMAERGVDTLRFGPMKPVGLDDPRTGRWPWAVVQLRQDNALGTLWNMVGFQTKLKHAEQVRLFRTIPGLEKAEFARLGGLAPQHLHQQPAIAGRHAAAAQGAAHPLRRPDHRLRGLCGIGGDRPARRPLRGCGGGGRGSPPAPAHDSARRAAWPHHRRRGRRELPADERQFRPLPAARRRPHEESGPQAALYRPGQGGPGDLAGLGFLLGRSGRFRDRGSARRRGATRGGTGSAALTGAVAARGGGRAARARRGRRELAPVQGAVVVRIRLGKFAQRARRPFLEGKLAIMVGVEPLVIAAPLVGHLLQRDVAIIVAIRAVEPPLLPGARIRRGRLPWGRGDVRGGCGLDRRSRAPDCRRAGRSPSRGRSPRVKAKSPIRRR